MKFLFILFLSILIISCACKAQICTGGSQGDPFINVTFGTYPVPLSPASTTLSFVGGCPFDTGSYTIQTLIFGCGETPDAHSWHLLAGDHTHNERGQFMLVNASWALGVSHPPFIIKTDTATGLCNNTSYEYAAWLANVMDNLACGGQPVLPNITFTVSTLAGAVLATASSGALPMHDSRVWQQNGVAFTTPAGVDAVILTLSIDPVRGCGNAFVVDDITFRMCGPQVVATIDGKTTPAKVCADYTDPFVLNGTYGSGFTDPVIQWQNSFDSGKTWIDMPGITDATYKLPRRTLGSVYYRMAVAERQNIQSLHCRLVSNPIITEVYPLPPHHAPQNIIGCISKDLHLPGADPSALIVEWTGPNGYSSAEPKAIVPNIQYADTGVYRLKQIFYFGCTSTDTFLLKVFPSTTVSTQTLYSVCEGRSIQLSASGTGTFKWIPPTGLSSDAIANPVVTPHDSIVYKVLVTNTYGCKDSSDVTINVFRNPAVTAGPDRTIVIGDTVLLRATATGTAISESWSPAIFIDDPQAVVPKVFPRENTRYTLTATSAVGCGTATSSALVKVYNDIYIPTAFTPNADGINDRFKIFAADGYKLDKFLIYNRWGQAVFTAKETSDGWDGNMGDQQQPIGVYIYYVEIENTQRKKIVKKGTFALIR